LISAGALPQTPLGELTVLPHTPKLYLKGPTSKGRGGRGKRRESKGEGKGRGRERGLEGPPISCGHRDPRWLIWH